MRTVIPVLGAVCMLLVTAGAASRLQTGPARGEQIYTQYCASCHDQASPRIPPKAALQTLTASRILRTLDFGVMMNVAYPIRRDEREAVARFLGTAGEDAGPSPASFCRAGRQVMAGAPANWTGWSPTPANTRYQPAGAARLTAADVGRLELKWAFGFRGDVTAFAAPTLVNGTLFVGSASGAVQALDAASGCLHWVFQANGPVRAAPVAVSDGGRLVLVFGDQIGWVYALDARSGARVWMRRIEDHEATRLTGAPAVHDGILFMPAASWEETRAIDPQYPCCTFRGSVTALRVRDGSEVWKRYMVDAPVKTGATRVGTETFGPSGAGIWSTPTLDAARGVLYVTTGDNYSHPATLTSDAVVALDLKSGRIVWTQQTTPKDVYNSACGRRGANCPEDSGPDHDYGAAAMLLRADGRDVLVAGQKSGVVYGLDPDQRGRILWQARVGEGGVNGGVQWGMASDGRQIYASVSDVGRLPAAPDAPPLGDAQFDPTRGGGLTALRIADGGKVWFAAPRPCDPPRPGCSPAQPGALTAIPGVVFSGSMDGHLRAFSTDDGRVLWDVDTAKTFTTVNGVEGKGGSLDGAGPVVAGGMVFVNSGYPRFGGMPGNLLLAFGRPD
ncbi:MAG: cytochrome C oxidase Cbb3 [Acidimicrobiia bacterium]|nr:cytochrome C oxidase Cbb3 [Acidimicrobiia bacterium]